MSIVTTNFDYAQYTTNDNFELILKEETKEIFMTLSGYSRMSGKQRSTVSNRLKKLDRDKTIQTQLRIAPTGSQKILLIPIEEILKFLLKDKPNLIKKLITTVYQELGISLEYPEVIEDKKKDRKDLEKRIQKAIAKKLNGQIEVYCKTGKIDILTDTEVIEVKMVNNWKTAIGQALVYQLEYPDRDSRIHLYGKCSKEYQQMVISFATKLGVIVTWERDSQL